MSTDTISNMLSRIKNASMVGKEYVEFAHSKKGEEVAKVLKKAGFIEDVKTFKERGVSHKSLKITLSYENGTSKIRKIKRVSKPGRRIYLGFDRIKSIKPEYGVVIVSTSKGVMSGEEARSKKLGGEIICEVV